MLAVLQVVVLELVVLCVWLPSMSAYHSRSIEYTALKSRENHYTDRLKEWY